MKIDSRKESRSAAAALQPLSHSNSFPSHTSKAPYLQILYFNSRSILPKMDELLALVEADNPDLICVTETWLNADCTNAEIAVPGYVVCRRDRDRHGGGVMLYIRDTFQFTHLLDPPEGLELLPIILQHNVIPVRLCIAVFLSTSKL